MEERSYTSVSVFSAELASVFTSEIGVQPAGDTAELQMQISGRAPELSLEQREKRKLAKRIIKAIQPALEDAIKKESELNRKPFEEELKELDQIFEDSVRSRRNSAADLTEVTGAAETGIEAIGEAEAPNGAAKETEGGDEPTAKQEPHEESQAAALPDTDGDHAMTDADTARPPESRAEPQAQDASATSIATPEAAKEPEKETTDVPSATVKDTTEDEAPVNGDAKQHTNASPQPAAQAPEPQKGPPKPPLSSQADQKLPLAQGGIQWYMEPFDPVGTTIHEERWTGRDVMRGMSEELSELDEDDLMDLVDDGLEGKPQKSSGSGADADGEPPVKVHQTRRRLRTSQVNS